METGRFLSENSFKTLPLKCHLVHALEMGCVTNASVFRLHLLAAH
jgi:hypothetical protein